MNELIQFLAPHAFKTLDTVITVLLTTFFLRGNISSQEFEKIKSAKFSEVLDDLLKKGKMTYMELYEANNFLTIAKKAGELYSEENNRKFDEYDFDWFVRFYEYASHISNEEIQQLWAKILAGELKRSSSYSLRTLDALRSFGKKEVELFNKVYSSSIVAKDNIFFPNYDNYMKYCGLQYSDIMFMDELGIMDSNGLIVMHLSRDNTEKTLFNNNNLVIESKSTSEHEEFDCKEFPYTQVGRELATLQDCVISNNDFMTFANEWKKEEKYNIGVYRITGKVGVKLQHDSSDLLENYDQAG